MSNLYRQHLRLRLIGCFFSVVFEFVIKRVLQSLACLVLASAMVYDLLPINRFSNTPTLAGGLMSSSHSKV